MTKIKRSSITEELFWIFKCPKCGVFTEIHDECDMMADVRCDYCDEVFEIED